MNNWDYMFEKDMTTSSIHKLNYSYKILSIILMFIMVIFADSLLDIFIINFFIFVILIWSNIRIRTYIRNLSIFGVGFFLIFFIVSLIRMDIFVGLMWLVKVFDIILYISIISITSNYYDLVCGVRNLIFPLRFFIDINKASLRGAWVIKFVSVLYDEWDRNKMLKRLRGVKFNLLSFVDRIDVLVNEIGPMVRLSLVKYNKLKSNMYVKKYGVLSFKYNYRLNKWGKTDTMLLVINVIVIFVIFIY